MSNKAHSSVFYIEPNSFSSTSTYDGSITSDHKVYDKIINPEDYCIGLIITTEICNRNSSYETEFIKLVWDASSADGSKVNFMSGTMIKGDPFLTTNTADMYVTDLKDYGTTEMIGIKSVDIDFENAVLPVITVQFTDVRGMSLFTPTQLSRVNNFGSRGSIMKDNVAQSFFQCFFKFPYPKFNITVKGFYGKPVTYEVTCDKFETNFNAEKGDYDVTARFIGYKYSFLSDISLELLYSAPYADYLGKEYWNQKCDNGDFSVTDVNGNKVKMPTLVQIRNNINLLLATGSTKESSSVLTQEEDKHELEIMQLELILEKYREWYDTLNNSLIAKFNTKDNEYVYVEKDDDEKEYKGIILLTCNTDKNDLSEELEGSIPSNVASITSDLKAAIKTYNETYPTKLDDFNADFSSFSRFQLFDESSTKTKIVRYWDCKIDDSTVRYVIYRKNGVEKLAQTIYNDGVHKYLYGYYVDIDYSQIVRRIKLLKIDANEAYEKKRNMAELHNRNLALIEQLGFNPTISNVTKIIMAHIETLMHMIYKTTDEIISVKRTPETMGMTLGEDGNLTDIKKNDLDSKQTVPPFPRVTRNVIDGDNVKTEDAWMGNFKGENLLEVDLVETFFNAINEIWNINKQADEQINAIKEASESGDMAKSTVKYPLTPYDLFLDKNVYGEDTLESIDHLSGYLAMRMFGILGFSGFKNERGIELNSLAKEFGEAEAYNFYQQVNISSNGNLRQWIDLNNNPQLTTNNILNIIKDTEKPHPWGYDSGDRNAKPLFDSSSLWLDRYQSDKYTFVYPLQNMSFDGLKTKQLELSGGVESYNGCDYGVSFPNKSKENANTYNAFKDGDILTVNGALFIEDNIDKIEQICNNAAADTSCSAYTKIIEYFKYNNVDSSLFDYERPSLFRNDIDWNSVGTEPTDWFKLNANAESGMSEYFSNGSINGFFIGEIYGNRFVRYGDKYQLEFDDGADGYYIRTFSFDGKRIEENQDLTVDGFLFGIKCLDYKALGNLLIEKEEDGKGAKTILLLPRIAILQMGAIINKISDDDSKFYKSVDGLKIPSNYNGIIRYLNLTSPYTRMKIHNYYTNWINTKYNTILKGIRDLIDSGKCKVKRAEKSTGYYSKGTVLSVLLYKDSPIVKSLTSEMLNTVLYVKGGVNHFKKLDDGESYPNSRNNYTFNNVATIFLNAFILKLNELLGVNFEKDDDGSIVRITKESSNTSDEMRMELYRYLKQVYDKWIPSSQESDWDWRNFFEEGKDNNYKFYFIDSYYNKIGDKLLVNPQKLSEKIDTAMDYYEIGSSAYSLLGWIFQDNRCLFKCVQNFADLANPNEMGKMFDPLPYTEAMKEAGKASDFVVVYTYEPSKYLNIESSDFKDDGFMLNNEEYTPMAIKSRSNPNNYYTIPAFGVTYGKQYQSYFKNVSVNTKNSIQTQQAIFAKHEILNSKNQNNKTGVNAQDLFDIYTTQSYTCKVDMMGCAWVQPMMYFVLLNVPMFNGSYMIMKVNHRMKPGDMSTSFVGCRMANAANKFVEDIFISSEGEEGSELPYDGEVTRENTLADTTNDCPYKVYPIFNDLIGDKLEKGSQLMSALIKMGYTKIAAAGIVGNMCQEVGQNFDYTTAVVDSDSFIAGGLCGWNDKYGNLTHLLNKNSENFGKAPIVRDSVKLGVDGVKSKLASYVGVDYQLTFIDETIGQVTVSSTSTRSYSKEILNSQTTPENAAESFRAAYERGTNSQARQKNAREFYDNYDNTVNKLNNTESSKDNQDIYEPFFNVIYNTSQHTDSMRFDLKHEISYTSGNQKKKVLMIMPSSESDRAKMSKVFDCILNTREYFKYVTDLYWVCNSQNVKEIERVDVVLSNKEVQPNNQHLYIYTSGSKNYNTRYKCEDLSDELKRSLAKKMKEIAVSNLRSLCSTMLDGSMYETDIYKCLSGFNAVNCSTLANYGSGSRTIGGNIGSRERASALAALGFSSRPSKSECDNKMTTITVETLRGDKKLTILNNQSVISEVTAIFKEIKNSGFDVRHSDTGAYCYREIAGSKHHTLSLHSFGIAIDINWSDNPLIRGKKPLSSGDTNIKIRTMNSPVVRAFQNHGWGWGGRYGDYMHFSRLNGS